MLKNNSESLFHIFTKAYKMVS